MSDEITHLAKKQLALFGENLRLARVRRGDTQQQFADRMGISRRTLIEVEKGAPTVAFGIYAHALWLIGMADDIGQLADPDRDTHGKVIERARAPERVRAAHSAERERYNF